MKSFKVTQGKNVPRRNNKKKNKMSHNQGNPTGDLEKEEIN